MLPRNTPKRPITLLPAGPVCLQAQFGSKKEASGLVLSLHYSGATYPEPQLNRSRAVLQDSSYRRLAPEPLQLPTRRPFKACRSYAGYSWTARSSRFVNPVMLPDHLHVQNVTTPLHQCGLLWIVTDISAWLSQ